MSLRPFGARMRESTVAVAGAGLTGASWAGLFAAAGLEVHLFDVCADALEPALHHARAEADFLCRHGLAPPETAAAGVAALSASTDPAAFEGVCHVQECVREDLRLKREVFALIDSCCPPNALICTSSSGLSVSDIQTATRRPQRCLAAHPYNPPHLVPLVELAPGALTESWAMERAHAFFTKVGKEAVVMSRDVPGYIANRLSAALWREAIELVRSGVATVEEVDRAVRHGPGLRWAVMGPHLLYDLGGGQEGIRGHMAHLSAVKETMLRDLADWTTFPPDSTDVLAAGLEAERAGRSFEQLTAQRDELLAAYLAARRRLGS